MPSGKREQVARICERTLITKLLEVLPKRNLLLVLNYHRIGDASQTPYDSGTFSATAEEFERQIRYFRRQFHVASLEEAVSAALDGGPRQTILLITFDDGYIDNYNVAFPILRSLNTPAAFFLPTAFVGTGRLPWWDIIAYVIKGSKRENIRVRYPREVSFDVRAQGLSNVTMRILGLFKDPSMQDGERFISELETACESPRPAPTADRCFLNWEEAREMQEAGMGFGSHTHTHEILAKLSASRQQEELATSRQILESHLGRRIDTLAYPVGAPDTFSDETVQLLQRCNYRASFSFHGGMNRPGEIQPFNIKRYGVGEQSHSRLRLQTALGTVTTRYWL